MSAFSPTVFLHGFLGGKDDWKSVANALGSPIVKLGVDLPGHGESKVGDEAFSFDGCALLVADSVGEMGVKRFSLVGYSLGGRMALYLAIRFPQFVERLVLVSATAGIESEEERKARIRSDDQLARQLETEGLPRFLERWYDQPLFESLRRRQDLLDQITERRVKGNARSLAKALRTFSVGRQPSLWNELPSLTMPVLFVAGELDANYVSIARRMADLCPESELCIISQAGHAVHLEQPEALASELKNFLTED